MQHEKDSQEILRKITVRIRQSGSNKVLGTGVIVTGDGLILTCYHVIASPKTKTIIDKIVDVYFPKAGITKRAEVLEEEYCSPSMDVAFLKLQEPFVPSDTQQVATLSESIYRMHHFQSFGFREPKVFEGLYAHGNIHDITAKNLKDIGSSTNVIQLYSDEIGRGMSGAPILDLETDRIIGIISDHYKSENEVDTKLNFGIPVTSIIQVYPAIKSNNRALVIGDFLTRIKSSNDLYYLNIDYLYVPPREYDDIIKILEHDKVVIITGHPEYGKTYTAVRLLWEYYNKGYVPFLVEVEDKKVDLKRELNDLRQNMQNKKIILYLNDPFGKIKYNKDADVESINNLINEFRNQDTSYLIITTRDKIYNKVKNTEFKSFKGVVRFEIDKPSYDDDKRKQLLILNAEYKSCKWFYDNSLKMQVLVWLEEKNMLPTLLNIHDFATATVKVDDRDELREIIEIKSRKTPESFSQEIKRDHYDLMNFLSFPFISDWFSLSFVRTEYSELIKNHRYKDNYKFEKIALLFNDKISTEEFVRFRHPSYSESLSYLLESDNDTAEDRQEPNQILEDFSAVLHRLLQKPNAIRYVVYTIARYYRHLPTDVQKLLFEMIDHPLGTDILPYAIMDNFKHLEWEDVKDLLETVAEKQGGAVHLIHAIARNLNTLPIEVRDGLITKLANSGDTVVINEISRIIYENFGSLEADTRNALISDLARRPYYRTWCAHVIVRYYDSLPQKIKEDLILDSVKEPEVIRYLITAYDSLPQQLKDFVFTLVDKIPTALALASMVEQHFHTISEPLRNELVHRLAQKDYAAYEVFKIIMTKIRMHNLDPLSPDFQQLEEFADKLLEQALNYHKESLKVHEELNDRIQMAEDYKMIGEVLLNQINDDQALSYYTKALKVHEELNDRIQMAEDYEMISHIFANQENYDQVLECLKKILKVHEELNDRIQMAEDYRKIGDIFASRKNDKGAAIESFSKGLQVLRELEEKTSHDNLHRHFLIEVDISILQRSISQLQHEKDSGKLEI